MDKDDAGFGIGGALLAGFVGVGLIALIRKSRKEAAEEKQRKRMTCDFSEGISQKEFEEIAQTAAKKIKRITSLIVNGPELNGVVTSKSGISNWNFTVDFNDYGHLTGRYWISSNNDDSGIPLALAKKIAEEIENRIC